VKKLNFEKSDIFFFKNRIYEKNIFFLFTSPITIFCKNNDNSRRYAEIAFISKLFVRDSESNKNNISRMTKVIKSFLVQIVILIVILPKL